MAVVEVNNLFKAYSSIEALIDFSLQVKERELVALVGPDGAGKTSLFRSMCNLIDFDRGNITLFGYDLKKQFSNIKPLLGYMPQVFSLYPDLSVAENLVFYAGLFGLTGTEARAKMEQLYEFSGLGPFAGRRAADLSGGMKQKLALSCNLIHEPKILILDEPTTGVDPLSRRQFWEILKRLKDDGSTIIVSTPYMDEVELADRSIFIYQGQKLAEGTPSELTRKFSGKVYRVRLTPKAEVINQINQINGLTARRFGSSLHLYLNSGDEIESFYSQLAAVAIRPKQIEQVEPDLEDTFIQLMG
jgi:ABC-type multidrug transport system ATPase subunit